MTKQEAADRAGGMTREDYADQLLAARAMLAALKDAIATVRDGGDEQNLPAYLAQEIRAAITQAEAAGITTDNS